MGKGLIAELEAAPEGSRELDCKILVALREGFVEQSPFNGRWCVYVFDHHGTKQLWRPARKDPIQRVMEWTTSIDDALSLVPAGWGWSVGDTHGTCESAGIGRPWAEIWKRGARPVRLPGMHRTTDGRCLINAAVPALALCIASLRARQAMEGS